jgi:hypothetical protein
MTTFLLGFQSSSDSSWPDAKVVHEGKLEQRQSQQHVIVHRAVYPCKHTHVREDVATRPGLLWCSAPWSSAHALTVLPRFMEDDALDGPHCEHCHAQRAIHPQHMPCYPPCSTIHSMRLQQPVCCTLANPCCLSTASMLLLLAPFGKVWQLTKSSADERCEADMYKRVPCVCHDLQEGHRRWDAHKVQQRLHKG